MNVLQSTPNKETAKKEPLEHHHPELTPDSQIFDDIQFRTTEDAKGFHTERNEIKKEIEVN